VGKAAAVFRGFQFAIEAFLGLGNSGGRGSSRQGVELGPAGELQGVGAATFRNYPAMMQNCKYH
jgi:hypothetical protein